MISLNVIRWKFMLHKINKVLGMYSHLSDAERLERTNEIFKVFLQAMEFHPEVATK